MLLNDSTGKCIMLCRVFALSMVLFITGCASEVVNMIPQSYEIEKRYDHSVSVRVEGMKEMNPMLVPTGMSNKKFTKALQESLRRSGVFSKVIEDGESEYILQVSVRNFSQPYHGGFDMVVYLVTNWKLSDPKSNNVIWSDIVSTTYKAKLTDNLIGGLRMKLATEGAIRTNIKTGIFELSRLDL